MVDKCLFVKDPVDQFFQEENEQKNSPNKDRGLEIHGRNMQARGHFMPGYGPLYVVVAPNDHKPGNDDGYKGRHKGDVVLDFGRNSKYFQHISSDMIAL